MSQKTRLCVKNSQAPALVCGERLLNDGLFLYESKQPAEAGCFLALKNGQEKSVFICVHPWFGFPRDGLSAVRFYSTR